MSHQVSQPIHIQGVLGTPAEEKREGFRTLILDHSSRPHHFGQLVDANRTGEAENPVCGDRYRVYLKLVDWRIEAIRFTGTGCCLSMASASMMADRAEQTQLSDIHALIDRFYGLFTGETSDVMDESLGDLFALAEVRSNPLRIKCATLPWRALGLALRSETD